MKPDLCRNTSLFVVKLGPSRGLCRQAARWRVPHSSCASGGRDMVAIRDLVDRSRLEGREPGLGVVVDATDDPTVAIEAFREVAASLRAERVVVYTERMHPGLELVVRERGSLLLLGPLEDRAWRALFGKMCDVATSRTGARKSNGLGKATRRISAEYSMLWHVGPFDTLPGAGLRRRDLLVFT